MTHYLAITIGPIYETFRHVRHTREVWGASYLFSHTARLIIEDLCHGNTADNAQYFIQPNITGGSIFERQSGVGLFPDRIIVDAKILRGREFEDIKKTVLTELAKTIGNEADVGTNVNFLKNYIRIDNGIFEVKPDENPIKVASQFLDAAELKPHFATEYQKNPLKGFFKTINKKDGFLKSHYRAVDVNNTVRFESLVEIATRELWTKDDISKQKYVQLVNQYLWVNDDDEDSDGDFVKALQKEENFKVDFKTYHKYICVVKADGDAIGKHITSLKTISEIQSLSKSLLDWGVVVKDTIRNYGGVPIYVGGDDLLFFAPVCNKQSKVDAKNIVALLRKIKTDFEDSFIKSEDFNPSLSFGLSITYYKFPLSEAMAKADSLLMQVKKNENTAQGLKGGKLAMSLIKHSGSTFDLELKLNEKDEINQLEANPLLASFDAIFEQMKTIDDQPFLNGVNYKIRENSQLIQRFGTDADRLKNLFENVFDEDPQKPEAKHLYLKELRTLIPKSFGNEFYLQKKDIKNHQKESTELATNEIFSIVRLAKFLCGLEDIKD